MVLAVIILSVIFSMVFLGIRNSELSDAQAAAHRNVLATQQKYLDDRGVVIRKEFQSGFDRFIVDDVHENIYINSIGAVFVEIPFGDIIKCEMTQDAPNYMTEKQETVSRAIVGGMIAGGAGAVIGAASAKEKVTAMPGYYHVTIYTRNLDHPQITLTTKDQTFAANIKASIYAIQDRGYSSIKPKFNPPVEEPRLPEPPKAKEGWCAYCHKEIALSDASCKHCKKPLPDNAKVIKCGFCGKLILKSEAQCRYCGYKVG